MADHLVPQILRIFFLQPQPVIFLILVPVLQPDHQIDALGILDAGYAEQGLDVDDADAAQLNEMLGDVRRGADQRIVADLSDLHHIVGNQAVSSLDQLQGRLRFSDAALARDQDALAVYVHQHAVNGDARRQPDVQPADGFGHEGGGGLLGHQDGNLLLNGDLTEERIRLKLPAVYHAGHGIGEKLIVDLQLPFLGHGFHIRVFHKADDLQPRRLMVFKIAGKLQRRSVEIRLCDPDSLHLDLRRQIFQLHLLYQVGKIDMRHNFPSFPFFCSTKTHPGSRNGRPVRLPG